MMVMVRVMVRMMMERVRMIDAVQSSDQVTDGCKFCRATSLAYFA